MESQVLAAVGSEERAFADLEAFANRLADGDPSLLDEGEGLESGSLAGEEYRARLSRAQEEGQLDELQNMPWGVGSAFVTRTVQLEEGLDLVRAFAWLDENEASDVSPAHRYLRVIGDLRENRSGGLSVTEHGMPLAHSMWTATC